VNFSKVNLYSKKVESESVFEKGDSAFNVLADQILEIGDVNEAMRSIVQEGFIGNDDRPVGGLKDILTKLEEERRFLLEKYSNHQELPSDILKELEKYQFFGSESLTPELAEQVLTKMERLNELNEVITEAMKSGQIGDLDLDALEELLGSLSRVQIEEIFRMITALEEAGYLLKTRDRFKLGSKAIKEIAQNAMREIFSQMRKGNLGAHDTFKKGDWGDLTGQTVPYEFGQSFEINLQKSLFNTVVRDGSSIPLRMQKQDLEVNEHEHLTQSATVLMLDQSRSMGMYGTFTAAKKVALALYWLVQTKFPRDKLFVVGFSDYGMNIEGKDLPESTWNHWVAGTNMHHGLILSRQLLARQNVANKQILMVTDGEPTAHMEGGQAYFSYPPTPRTLDQTLKEVKRCTREGIVINTFMLEMNYFLMEFMDQMAKINNGRSFYTKPDQLGRYMLVDYLEGRKRKV